MYCTVDDIRAEGFEEADYSDDLVTARIALAQAYIERRTGLYFERRLKTYVLDGTGRDWIELPAPVCQGTSQLTSVLIGRTSPQESIDQMIVYNDDDERRWPRLRFDDDWQLGDLIETSTFASGRKNITVSGYFGFVDYTLTPGAHPGDPDVETWTTPIEIQRVAMRLVARDLALLSDFEGQADRQNHRVISETTRYRSITLASLARTGGPTGDPDIDEPLAAYTRPPFMATV